MNKNELITGKEDLDKLNIFRLGNLVTFGSRPGVGKSITIKKIMLDIVKNSGICAVLFDLEYSKEVTEKRLLSFENDYNLDKLNFIIDDTPNVDIDYITDKIKSLVSDSNIKLVVIDYLQLISSSFNGTRVQILDDISRKLKTIVIELNICVVILTQLPSEIEFREDKTPKLNDLRIFGSLSQDSDVIMFLYKNNNDNHLIVAKNRYGELSTIFI